MNIFLSKNFSTENNNVSAKNLELKYLLVQLPQVISLYYIELRGKTVRFSQVNVTVTCHFYLAYFRTGRLERILAETVYCTWYKNTRKLHEVIGKYTRPYMIHDSFLVYTKTRKIDFVKHFQTCSSRYIGIYLLSLVTFQFSFFLALSQRVFFKVLARLLQKLVKYALFLKNLPRSYKKWRTLEDSCRQAISCNIFSRFLQELRCLQSSRKNHFVCKNLAWNKFSARIFEDVYFCKNLRESCKIYFSTHLRDTW